MRKSAVDNVSKLREEIEKYKNEIKTGTAELRFGESSRITVWRSCHRLQRELETEEDKLQRPSDLITGS